MSEAAGEQYKFSRSYYETIGKLGLVLQHHADQSFEEPIIAVDTNGIPPLIQDAVHRKVINFDSLSKKVLPIRSEITVHNHNDDEIDDIKSVKKLTIVPEIAFNKHDASPDEYPEALGPKDPYFETKKFIHEKAPEFYGTLLLSANPTYRIRLINKAFKKMEQKDNIALEPAVKEWVETIKPEKASNLGIVAIHNLITVPIITVENDEESVSIRQIQAIQAFRIPKIRKLILNDLVGRGDQAAIVISELEKWREDQREQPKQSELVGSQRSFENVLFKIHEGTFPQYIQTLIHARKMTLDI